jgi:hypothetical protein
MRGIHKKVTEEDKFARRHYCTHTRNGMLRSEKKQQKKALRSWLKKIEKEMEAEE